MTLEEIYLDYLNSFTNIENMAEYYGVEESWMDDLIRISRKMFGII